MKKLVTLVLILACLCGESKAQYVALPDGGFKYLLQGKYPDCFNSSGLLDTTCSSIINEDSINVDNTDFTPICSSIEGVQYFKNLVYLSFSGQHVQTISSLPSTLLHLDCSNNYFLNNLPGLPPGLKFFDCSGCSDLPSITSFPNSLRHLAYAQCQNFTSLISRLPDSLVYLDFHYTNITRTPLPSTLKYLDCGGHYTNSQYIANFPPLLDTLICDGGDFSNLPPLPATLKYLNCGYNSISALPVLLPDSLKYLNIAGNYSITSIPALPINLEYLNCSQNNIPFLPALPQTLMTLICTSNRLANLPLLPNNIRNIDCSTNPLNTVPALPDSLRFFTCSSDSLTYLPALPSKLQSLVCTKNKLTFLPDLPPSLNNLDCSYNLLSNLPVVPLRISYIKCSHNDIRCLPYIPELPESGVYLTVEVDPNEINCISNIRTGNIFLVARHESTGTIYPIEHPPLCNPTNNINHCQSFPIISGNVFYDNNNNGIKDTNENYKPNGKFELSNGSIAYSDNNGYFEINTGTPGTYTIIPTAPNYFNIIPSSATYNFTSYDTIASKDYALQANTIKDSLAIKLTPINWAARPGFSFPYMISYENTGTTTLSSNIEFDYDETRLTYNTSTVNNVVDNSNRLSYNIGSLAPGESGSFIGYFTLKTTVPLGDTLNAKAIISANTFTAYDSVQTNVRGAFDPNDKQATPQLSPSQVANGKYIDYTIRFQNTGTDTAFNIVLSDTLNENLQAGTLEMLASSHTCKATVKDNIVFFEFLNILLPDSNVNEPKSHGFVSFRIQPQTTVAVNTTIPNKAAIYFDYNAPVITNTAGTLIKDFTTIPLKLISFSAVPQNDNTVSLYWNTANEINTKQFVIEKGNDGLRFSPVTTIAAKGKATNDYYTSIKDENTGITFYRLKIVDNDGTFSYSPIIKIDRRKNAAGFSILTNPVKNFIVINTTDKNLNNTQANIINMQGATVKSFIIKEGSQTVEIKGLPNGIYYLRTVNGSSKVLKQ